MNNNSKLCLLNLAGYSAPPVPSGSSLPVQVESCPTRRRLLRAFHRMEDLQLLRNHGKDQGLGKATEERIIWRELLELELQALDEQSEQVAATAKEHWENRQSAADQRF